MTIRLFIATAAASLAIGCASTHLPQPAQAHATEPKERHVYRLDFVVAANDLGKPPQSSAYTLNLEEFDTGEIHMGTNVILSPGTASPRMDVGLKLKANIRPAGDDLVFHGELEMSGVEDTTVHKVTADGDAVLSTGKTALVASLEDPLTHRHYQVTAEATKLR